MFLAFGMVLFYAGWSTVEKDPIRGTPTSNTVVVVRPLGTSLNRSDDVSVLEGDIGKYQVEDRSSPLNISKPSWGDTQIRLEPGRPLKTVRLSPPLATFDPMTKDGTKIELKTLPDKEALERKNGLFHLKPGRYQFVATAKDHLPETLSAFFRPGEKKKQVVALKAVPKPPDLTPKRPRPSPPISRPARPTRPRPTYQAPPPRPAPRFTPVAPPAKPEPTQPVPFFTPVP